MSAMKIDKKIVKYRVRKPEEKPVDAAASADVTAIKGRELRLSELAQRNETLATVVGAVSSGIVICDATRPDPCLGQVFVERDDHW